MDIKKSKGIYWGLIGTFTALYLAVAFVSTLHAITFFQIANSLSMAILLGVAYEVGQASVLFSILMTENKNKTLAWGMMFLLTALQVTANVYSSFLFMDQAGSTDWTYWQRSILFWVEADGPEMFKVIISWITGALLPLVALGMTALVAENLRLAKGEESKEDDSAKIDPMPSDIIIENGPEFSEPSIEDLDDEASYVENNKDKIEGTKDKFDQVYKKSDNLKEYVDKLDLEGIANGKEPELGREEIPKHVPESEEKEEEPKK